MKNSHLTILKLFAFGFMALIPESARCEDVIGYYKNQIPKTLSAGEAPSIAKGKNLFFFENVSQKGQTMSCTVCHTKDATQIGKTRAGKAIEPLAPSKNPNRFTNIKQVEKWFFRNCRDVLDRECSATEKLSFILYMKSI